MSGPLICCATPVCREAARNRFRLMRLLKADCADTTDLLAVVTPAECQLGTLGCAWLFCCLSCSNRLVKGMRSSPMMHSSMASSFDSTISASSSLSSQTSTKWAVTGAGGTRLWASAPSAPPSCSLYCPAASGALATGSPVGEARGSAGSSIFIFSPLGSSFCNPT